MAIRTAAQFRAPGLALVCCFVLGCGVVFHRSRPSPEKYLAQHVPELPQNQIAHLDYTYEGAVGGYVSLARIQVNDTNALAPLWDVPEEMVLRLDDDQKDMEVKFLKSQFTVSDGSQEKKIPSWVDLTYSEPVHIHKDTVDHRHTRKFFLGTNTPVFYMIVAGD